MRWWRDWRSWIRQLVMTIYGLILIVAVALIAVDLDRNKAETHVWGWFVGGLFVLFSLPVSLWGILQHLVHYTKPALQRREIRIMWMVPIYATDAWLALRFPSAAIYLDTLRECYEAYVVYNFMYYLLAYLWETHPFLERELLARQPIRLTFPLCCLKRWNGKEFLNRCKHGVLQYTIVRPITTVIALICEICGVYYEGDFKGNGAWTYLVIIDSISQMWALYCLVLFYENMKEELKPMKPLKKFLCVKFVIFLSFWQQVIIAILVATGIIQGQADWVLYDTKKISTGIQDFAICIEMFFAAIAHYFAYSHRPYIDPSQERSIGSFFHSMRHMFDVDDVTDDVRDHVRVVSRVASKTFSERLRSNKSTYGSHEETTPLVHFSAADDDEDSFTVSFDYRERRFDTDSLRNFAEFSLPGDTEERTSQIGPPGFTGDRSSSAGPPGVTGDRSSSAGPTGVTEDKSSSVGPPGVTGDRSSSAGPPGVTEDKSSSVGPPGVTGDRSSSAGPPGVTEDKSSSVVPPGVTGDRSTPAGLSGKTSEETGDPKA